RSPDRQRAIEGIAGDTEGARLGVGNNPELGNGGLSDHDETGGAEAQRQGVVARRSMVGGPQSAIPHVVWLSSEGGADVLEQERHTTERPLREIGGPRRQPRFLEQAD